MLSLAFILCIITHKLALSTSFFLFRKFLLHFCKFYYIIDVFIEIWKVV